MIHSDPKCNINTIHGRINVCILMLIHHFGREELKRVLSLCDKIMSEDAFKALSLLNIIIPESVQEMNIRNLFLWSALTSALTGGVEAGKRQTVTRVNDVDRFVTGEPIKSFFDVKQSDLLPHRKTPNSHDQLAFSSQLSIQSGKFYSRAKTPVKTDYYCLESIPGITVRVARMMEIESNHLAAKNMDIQKKYVDAFLVDILKKMASFPHVLNSVIVPDKEEETEEPTEKPLIIQLQFIRRFFVMMAIELCDTYKTKNYQQFINTWGNHAMVESRNFALKKLNKATLDESVASPKDFFDSIWKKQQEFMKAGGFEFGEKWRYKSVQDYDPMLLLANPTAVLVPPKPESVPEDVLAHLDIKQLSFWSGYFATYHKEYSHITKGALKWSANWRPGHWGLLQAIVSFCCYSQQSCQVMIDLIQSNGKKTTSAYPDKFVHDALCYKTFQNSVSY